MANYFDLKVGFTCNNNCVHCVITDKKDTKDLSTQEIKDIIDGVPKEQMVGFTGGEATIRHDFIELLKYAKDTGHATALQTNGTQFADWDFAAEAAKYLDDVLIAIHSHIPEVHNSIVRISGMYDKTIEGFKNIIKLKIPHSTQTVISKLNVDDLCETYDFIQGLDPGVNMSLTYPHPNGNALHNADIVCPSYTEIKDILQKIFAKHASHLRTEAIPMCYLYPYQDRVYNFDEHLANNEDRRGMDPANKNKQFFDESGITENYTTSIISEKRKGPRCIECIFNDRCFGVWKEYTTLHGKHFDLFPITKEQNEAKIPAVDYSTISPADLADPSRNSFLAKVNTEAACSDEKCECNEEANPSSETPKVSTAWGSLIVFGGEQCMNSCTFCSGHHGPGTPEAMWGRYISEADHFIKNTNIRQIEISGGDPGEYDRISELISYLRDNGVVSIQLSTHGRTLKDEDLVIALKKAGVTSIRIPLYGSTDIIHNKTAQYQPTSGNAFADAVEGIKNVAKHGIRLTGYTLLNQYNKDDILNIMQLYLDLAGKNLTQMFVGITFISQLDYSYTKDWFLPIKDLKPYIKKVYENYPEAFEEIESFAFLDIPYCVFGEWTDLVDNRFEGFPNLGIHNIEDENRSEISSKIPHYRIKSYFAECEKCDLNDCCGAVPLNEIKMFGTYGLKAIKK